MLQIKIIKNVIQMTNIPSYKQNKSNLLERVKQTNCIAISATSIIILHNRFSSFDDIPSLQTFKSFFY